MRCVDPTKGRFSFRFIRTDKMLALKDEYYKNHSKVNPVDLLKNMRHLKAKIESNDVGTAS